MATVLHAEHVSLVANGMLTLAAAIDAFDIVGEVITKPYSFVATAHAVAVGLLNPRWSKSARTTSTSTHDGTKAHLPPLPKQLSRFKSIAS